MQTATSSIPDIKLYQFEICPFCNQVKALLDYARLPYQTVEVLHVNKKKQIDFSKQYKQVPILVVNGQQYNGTEEILQTLVAILKGTTSGDLIDSQRVAALDGDAAVAAAAEAKRIGILLYLHATNSWSRSFQLFNYIYDVPATSMAAKVGTQAVGGGISYLVAYKKTKAKYGIVNEEEEMIVSLEGFVRKFSDKGRMFHGGEVPDLFDLAAFGTCRAVEHTDTWNLLASLKNSEIPGWLQRMQLEAPRAAKREWTSS